MPRRSSSSGNFGRKLQPAKRALRRLAHTLQTKLNDLDFPRAIRVIRKGTNRILTYCSTHLFRNNRSLQVVPNTPSYRHHNHHNYISDYYTNRSSSNRNLLRKSFSAIFIDQLYPDDDNDAAAAEVKIPTTTNRVEATSLRGKEVVVRNVNKRPPLPRNSCREGAAVRTASSLIQRRRKDALVIMDDEEENNPMETLEDAWRVVVARSPQLRPVDVRAEEFIYNFRAGMKTQKTKSILEKQNLLPARMHKMEGWRRKRH
ncbi:unnamed protein product [Linum tenue]|uniref:Uncharacterized protein n=1 Tax=Linum tenue TaxID=586396 RepID=A0AAV0NI52_9ROSI|nr:unnamed protein product [Linum tenue]